MCSWCVSLCAVVLCCGMEGVCLFRVPWACALTARGRSCWLCADVCLPSCTSSTLVCPASSLITRATSTPALWRVAASLETEIRLDKHLGCAKLGCQNHVGKNFFLHWLPSKNLSTLFFFCKQHIHYDSKMFGGSVRFLKIIINLFLSSTDAFNWSKVTEITFIILQKIFVFNTF